MPKKINQFLRHGIVGERIILWLNIGPSSLSIRYSSCGWASRSTPSWFCFSLWLARKSTCIRFQRIVFELHFWGFLLVDVLLLFAQVHDQLIQAMRNSDPLRELSLFKGLIVISTPYFNFQCGSSNPTFWFRWIFVSWQGIPWQGVLTTSHRICELWKFSSVFRHEILSDFNSGQESWVTQLVALFYHGKCHILRTYLRLLRKYWAD